MTKQGQSNPIELLLPKGLVGLYSVIQTGTLFLLGIVINNLKLQVINENKCLNDRPRNNANEFSSSFS